MTVSTKWKIGSYLLAIFCAGAVSGWMIEAKTAKQKMFAPPRPEEISDRISSSFRTRLHSQLELTPQQTQQVDAVLDRSAREMKSIHGECMKRISQGLNNRNAQISAILTPEQQKKFEQLEKERHEPWHGRGPGPWRHGPRERGGTNSPPDGPR
jgi:Spy/CpxP family protein refolding chaperone